VFASSTRHTADSSESNIHVNAEYSYRFCSPSLFYLLVHSRCRGFLWFHLITLKHTPQSVELLWTRDRPVAETSTGQHEHSQETDIHALGGIRTHDPSKRSAADLRLRRRGHWGRKMPNIMHTNTTKSISVAKPAKARTVFDRLNTRFVHSGSTLSINVCPHFSASLFRCVSIGHPVGRIPFRGLLTNFWRSTSV
jgi:hypothetical protein